MAFADISEKNYKTFCKKKQPILSLDEMLSWFVTLGFVSIYNIFLVWCSTIISKTKVVLKIIMVPYSWLPQSFSSAKIKIDLLICNDFRLFCDRVDMKNCAAVYLRCWFKSIRRKNRNIKEKISGKTNLKIRSSKSEKDIKCNG